MDPVAQPFRVDDVTRIFRTSALPSASGANVQAWMIRIGADTARVSLSVQKEAQGDGGIVRGEGPPFRAITEKGGVTFETDAARIRSDFLPVDGDFSHVSQSGLRHRVLAATGCGNLLTNEGVVAVRQGVAYGVPLRRGIRCRTALLTESGRTGTAVDIDPEALLANPTTGPCPRGPDGFLISGPRLVSHGRASPLELDAWADLRHVLLPAWTEILPGLRVDFGLDTLFWDAPRRAAAFAGHPVTLPLVAALPHGFGALQVPDHLPVHPSALRQALAQKGYRETADAEAPGTYAIREDTVSLSFLEGIYPHHALGILSNGLLASVVLGGKSNRAGVTIRDLSEGLVELGFRDAWLMDNGGDAALRLYGAPGTARDLVAPCEADRAAQWKLRAAFLWHAGSR